MREMVLNHASFVEASRHEADAWLKDLATGIEEVVRSGAALAVLRMDRQMYEIPARCGSCGRKYSPTSCLVQTWKSN